MWTNTEPWPAWTNWWQMDVGSVTFQITILHPRPGLPWSPAGPILIHICRENISSSLSPGGSNCNFVHKLLRICWNTKVILTTFCPYTENICEVPPLKTDIIFEPKAGFLIIVVVALAAVTIITWTCYIIVWVTTWHYAAIISLGPGSQSTHLV